MTLFKEFDMASSSSPSDKSTDPATQIEHVLDTANETVGHLKRRADEVAEDLGNMVRDSAENRPISTLAIAVAVGFVLGALWRP